MNPRDVFAGHLSGFRQGIHAMPMADYRAFPGFAPSDLKRTDPDEGGCILHLAAELHEFQSIRRGDPSPWPNDKPKKDADHFAFGTLLHHLVLEPEQFEETHAVVDSRLLADIMAAAKGRIEASEYNARFGEAQEWKKSHGRLPETDDEKRQVMAMRAAKLLDGEKPSKQPEFIAWQDEQTKAGKTVVWESDLTLARRVAAALHEWPATRQAMKIISDGTCEASLFAVEECGDSRIQLKGRPDCFGKGVLLDLKHTGLSISGPGFAKSVEKYGYDLSAGAYAELLARNGVEIHHVAWLVVETLPPYRATTHVVDLRDPDQAKRIQWGAWRYLDLARRIEEAHRLDRWDDWTEGGPKVLGPPSAYQQERKINQMPDGFTFGKGVAA